MLDLSALRLTRLLFKEVSRSEKAQLNKGGYHAWNHSSLMLLPAFKTYILPAQYVEDRGGVIGC